MKKLLGILFGLFIVFSSLAQETKTQLQTRFDVIRNETVAGANTKVRLANAWQELSDGSLGVYPVVATGTDTYAGTLLGLDAYSGRIVFVTFPNNNTGASTINFNSIGAGNIQKYDGGWTALEADDIVAGKLYRLYHDGTRFQIDLGGGGGAGLVDADYGDVTVSGTGTVMTIDNGVVTGAKIASSAALAGSPTTTTQSANTNNTTIATTAYSDAKVADALNNGTTAIAPSQNIVFDELALKATLASPTFTGTPAAPTPSTGNQSTQLATTAFVMASSPKILIIACSDETTAISTGTNKVTFIIPYNMTVTQVVTSLTTAQTSGSVVTVDINETGSSILSTKLTIDNTETNSTTAATPPVISDTSLAQYARITIDLDIVGDGTAKGLKVIIYGY